MNNHMSLKLVGANSSLELNSPITSIYLQEELTGLTTLPGIRETKGMNIGMDGGWTSAQFYEPRLITIKGVIANQDVAVVEQRRKQLIQLLAEKRLALEFQTEAGNHYTMNVVVAGVQMPLSKVLTASYFQINLRADDPLIYDNNALAELEAILRRSSSASSGFTINFPINFQLGTSESRPTIDNFGSSVIYPVITLTGPLTTPEIVNITTNMAFTIDEVLGAGTYTASGIRGAMTQEGSVDTYSGNPIQATRDAESPISKFSLYGDASQTTYTGKNLLQITNTSATTTNGITFTPNSDGSVKITGTATATAWFVMNNTLVLPAGTYTYSSHNSTFAAGTVVLYNDSFGYTGEKKTLTLAEGSTGNWSIRVSSGATLNTTAYPMIETGSNMTDFEPFVGSTPTSITASPNPDYPQEVNTVTGEQTVKIEGKNIFKFAQESGSATRNGVTITVDSYSGLTLNGTATSGFWCELVDPSRFLQGVAISSTKFRELDPDTWYSMSANILSGSFTAGTSVAPNFNIQIKDPNQSNGQRSCDFGTSSAFNTADGIYRAWLYIKSGDVFNSCQIGFQLEAASTTATAYEPYQVRDFEVNLGKNLAWDGWAQDFVNRINNTGQAKLETFDGKNCVWWKENTGYGSYDTKYLFKTNFKENTQYTVTFDIYPSDQFTLMAFYYTDGTATNFGSGLTPNTWTHKSVTSQSGKTIKYIRVNYNAGNVYLDLDTFQVELGSKATPFAPSFVTKNLLPIPNPYALTGIKTYNITLSPGTYTLSLAGATTTGSSQASYFRVFDDNNTDLATNTVSFSSANSWTFTLNSTATKFAIYSQNTYAGSSGVTTTFQDLMLEQGGAKTSYEPYGAPYKLCKVGSYQDYIWKDGGVWKIHRAVRHLSLPIAYMDNTDNYPGWKATPIIRIDLGINQNTQLNTITEWSSNISNSTKALGINTNSSNATVFTSNSSSGIFGAKTQTTIMSDYADLSFELYYGILEANQYDEEITNEALIDQLDAILEAHLYEGINNISNVTVSPNLSGDLEIKTGQTLTVIDSLSIVGSSGAAEIGLGGSELAMVGSVADELTINGTTGAVTKTTRIGKIESYAGETITTDYISTSGGLDSDATIYYVLPSSSTSVINTLDSTALAAFNGVVASGGVSAQTNIGSISVDVTTVTAQDVAVVDTKQHTVTINGVGAYSKFSGDWLTLDVGLNELQLITENNTDTGSAVIKYRVGYMGV